MEHEFILSNLKGKAAAQLPCCSCIPEVSFVTQKLHGDLVIQTKQSMSWLQLQLIWKVAVVGNWLGENQDHVGGYLPLQSLPSTCTSVLWVGLWLGACPWYSAGVLGAWLSILPPHMCEDFGDFPACGQSLSLACGMAALAGVGVLAKLKAGHFGLLSVCQEHWS